MHGKAFIFSAPSGAGKTTIVHHLIEKFDELKFSISATTRPIRTGVEQDGRDYYFLTIEQFRDKINQDEFVEWEEVYPGRYYGTLKSELERIWASGNHIVFDVDVVGGINLKKQLGSRALAVFISVEDVSVLETRLSRRNTDDPLSIRKRVDKAVDEMKFAGLFDTTLLNDDLEQAKKESERLVIDFLQRKI